MSTPRSVEELAASAIPEAIELRRLVHRHPELSGEEYRTTELIADRLRAMGMSPRLRTPRTGLWVDVGSGDRMIAFRSDIDALPIHEPPGQTFVSEVPGIMHACGHDAHAAIAVGVARTLHEMGSDLPGRVRVIFQPAEETFPGGAYDLVREGIMDGISAILAYHVDPGLDTGQIGFKAGAITSSADRFYVTLEGPGGHTARPHQTVDLLYAVGMVLTQVPAMLDRMIDARSPVAVVFGRAQAGTADNVIPTHAELSGTLRTADRTVWEEVPSMLEQLVRDITAPLGAKVLFHYQRGIPPVVNDPQIMEHAQRAITDHFGKDAVASTFVSMGAEDFARYLDEAPGVLLRLGCRDGSGKSDLHSAAFRLDEGCIRVGIEAAIASLLELLKV